MAYERLKGSRNAILWENIGDLAIHWVKWQKFVSEHQKGDAALSGVDLIIC